MKPTAFTDSLRKNLNPTIAFILCIAFCFTIYSCQNKTSTTSSPDLVSNNGVYDAPPVRSFPSSPDKIQKWIDVANFPKIRAHGWDIWESITTDTAVGANYPIWETWYTGHEIFEMGPSAQTDDLDFHPFDDPTQFTHLTSEIPIDTAQRPMSFNRFTNSVAQVIWDKKLNKKATFDTLNAQFNRDDTPIGLREASTSIDTVDAKSIVLKCVFQFISGDEPTALPYWRGNSPFYTSNQDKPEPHTWKQCVVIDPTGNLKVGSTHTMKCNEVTGDWPVISMDEIFNFKITEEEADAFSEFARTSGDDIGKDNLADTTDIDEMVKEGNYALMMAMHVTGKEIVNWTWQTYWWTHQPNSTPYGHDRPASIKAPWSNYNMRTAYFMTFGSDSPTGEPLIAFNPYLETNLASTFTPREGESIEWKGVFSNCMSCHRLSKIGEINNQYTSNGFVDKSDPYLFGKSTKTDFLWSIATRVE